MFPTPASVEETDALVVVSRAAICGSDLWPYRTAGQDDAGRRMGHEAVGVVEAIGADVRTLNVGDLVVMPYSYSDGTCQFCREGLQTSCVHGAIFGTSAVDGAQAEAVRVPLADGTLVALPVGEDDALLQSPADALGRDGHGTSRGGCRRRR